MSAGTNIAAQPERGLLPLICGESERLLAEAINAIRLRCISVAEFLAILDYGNLTSTERAAVKRELAICRQRIKSSWEVYRKHQIEHKCNCLSPNS
jgi:hypothetical protein